MSALLVRNARLVTPITRPGASTAWEIRELHPGAVFCEDHLLRRVGPESEVVQGLPPCEELDAGGRLLIPGLVDCHTHPVFFNHRAHEFVQRIEGATYAEIAAQGGGIRYSVRDLRTATAEQLLQRVLQRLDTFLAHGTTTIEAKSGYGLSVEHEIRSLEVLHRAGQQHAVEIVPTLLGAHEVPDEYRDRRAEYLGVVIGEMIPQVAARGLARFVDVFCENHVFRPEEAREVLAAAGRYGLRAKIHADQLSENGGARVAIEMLAASADHLEFTPPALYASLRAAGVVPVLLPGADFFIRSTRHADARAMIAAGLPVAIATDFNPGTSMTESLPMVMTLACVLLRMTPAQTLVAATQHAAQALGMGNIIGSLEVGKQADGTLLAAESIAEVPYHFGVNLVHTVIKKGRVVWPRPATAHVS